MHILLIEDDVNAASYVMKGLKESGHVVDHASDGEEGIQLALTLKFDVIVVDRMLPKLDGLSLINKNRTKRVRGSSFTFRNRVNTCIIHAKGRIFFGSFPYY